MTDPYWEYKDKVNYDYILKCNLPIKYESDDIRNITEYHLEQISEEIEKGIEGMIQDEDYMKECFPDLGIGRVYAGVNEVYDEIEMYFGISLLEKEKEVTTDSLIEDVQEFMSILDINTDYSSHVSGYEDEYEDVDCGNIYFRIKPKTKNIKVEILKQPINNEIKENLDKVLVNNSSLNFNNLTNNIKINLNNEGQLEYINKENKIIENFSKLALTNKINELQENNYGFNNSNYNALTNKTESIFNTNANEFPSNDDTNKLYTINELSQVNLFDILNEEQINWLKEKQISLEELDQSIDIFKNNLKNIDNIEMHQFSLTYYIVSLISILQDLEEEEI